MSHLPHPTDPLPNCSAIHSSRRAVSPSSARAHLDELTAPSQLSPWAQMRWFERVGVVLSGLAFTWLLLCAVSTAWLSWAVPLTDQDIEWASWAGSYTLATHFSGPFGVAFAVAVALMGLAMAVAQRSLMPLAAAAVFAVAVYVPGTQGALVREGVMDGTIRIGCYVWETRECLEQLGLRVEGAPSRYARKPDGGVADAPWYLEARAQVRINETRAAVASMPGGLFLQSPLLLGRAAELNARLEEQRAQVRAFRAARLSQQVAP